MGRTYQHFPTHKNLKNAKGKLEIPESARRPLPFTASKINNVQSGLISWHCRLCSFRWWTKILHQLNMVTLRGELYWIVMEASQVVAVILSNSSIESWFYSWFVLTIWGFGASGQVQEFLAFRPYFPAFLPWPIVPANVNGGNLCWDGSEHKSRCVFIWFDNQSIGVSMIIHSLWHFFNRNLPNQGAAWLRLERGLNMVFPTILDEAPSCSQALTWNAPRRFWYQGINKQCMAAKAKTF